MDPTACLQSAKDSALDGDRSEALESLSDYYHWRSHGGFEPTIEEIPGDWYAEQIKDFLHQRK